MTFSVANHTFHKAALKCYSLGGTVKRQKKKKKSKELGGGVGSVSYKPTP